VEEIYEKEIERRRNEDNRIDEERREKYKMVG